MIESSPLTHESPLVDASSDSWLVQAAKADPEAFSQLYLRYVDRVYGYMRPRVDSDEDAEDLTQQVFLRAFDALPKYRDRGLPFAAWLFRIARNIAIDNHRHRKRGDLTWDLVPESSHPVDRQDVQAEVLRQESLHRLLSRLDHKERELIVLHFVSGLTLGEIALVVGTSKAKIQRQMARTIQDLKEQHYERW